jgi:hypothetical protein
MKLTGPRAAGLAAATLVAVAVVAVGAAKLQGAAHSSSLESPTARGVPVPASTASGDPHVTPAKPHAGADPVLGIVGGSQSSNSFPFMGAIDNTQGFECGATLIGSDVILTAFHCVPAPGSDDSLDGWTVRLGSNDRTAGGTVVGLVGPAVHVGNADLAIIRLREPVSIQPAVLSERTLAPGDPVLNIGWGREGCGTDPVGDPNGPVPICSLPQYLKELHSTTIECPAGASQGDTCNRAVTDGDRINFGDSGSPLLVSAPDGTWQVAGVLSGTPADDPATATYGSTAYWKPTIALEVIRAHIASLFPQQ